MHFEAPYKVCTLSGHYLCLLVGLKPLLVVINNYKLFTINNNSKKLLVVIIFALKSSDLNIAMNV